MHYRTAITALATVALAATTVGTAHAEPTPVGYSMTADGGSVVTVLDAGAFRVDADGTSVAVVDDTGAVLTSIPLAYSVDGALHPVAAEVGDDGRSLTVTPDLSALLHPVYSPSAYQNLVTQIEIGWQNGGSVTGGIGAGIGAAVGCVLFLFVGCIPGAALGAALGVANGVVSANPAVTPAVFEFVRTLP